MKKKNFLDYLDLFSFAVMAFIFLISLILCFIIVKGNSTEWDNFKLEHNCKIVSKNEGLLGKTGWLCDDNITYYKY